MRHTVRCPTCSAEFDLFESAWCSHRNPSKRCPGCGECVCADPGYGEPRLWKEAPLAFRKRGFQRLFVRYL